MEKRKNPEVELRNKSGLFFHIGLLIAMMLCVTAFEYKSKILVIDIPDYEGEAEDVFLPPVTEIESLPKPKLKKAIANPVTVQEAEPDMAPQYIPVLEPLVDTETPLITANLPVEKAEEVFIYSEVSPSPIGGYESFYKFIKRNLKYPAHARKMDIEGKVFVQFVVNKDGELVDFQIYKGIGGGCDEEVLRIMNKAPKWNPGKQRGVPVRVKKVLPIEFRLN